MPSHALSGDKPFLAFADEIISALRKTEGKEDLNALMEAVTQDMGFRYFALIHHDDLRTPRTDRVDLKTYPQAIADRLFGECLYRRDPIIRGCIFADSAFLWSQLHDIIGLNRRDRESFELGLREGLNEGITTPYVRLGECMGSCTFAGTRRPETADRYLGPAQMIGIFAFQAARKLLVPSKPTLKGYFRSPTHKPDPDFDGGELDEG